MTALVDGFVHPISKVPLVVDGEGCLCSREKPNDVLFVKQGNSYDFAAIREETEDREYYEHQYGRLLGTGPPLCRANVESLWLREVAFRVLLSSVGDLQGKRVLLLGNGTSVKEFLFVMLGAKVVYTDLSIAGVRYMSDVFSASDFANQPCGSIEFHAVDALHLPFDDEFFDIIYGCAFVHHLDDMDPFIAEVFRCLRPGGKCVFFDDAYSVIWHAAKNTLFKPLQLWSHWRTGISPEDRRATSKGGFKYVEVEALKDKYRFRCLMFIRVSFFEYIVRRGAEKIGVPCASMLVAWARFMDGFLGRRTCFISRQGIRLVWGFEK